jgi:hypothetical protein
MPSSAQTLVSVIAITFVGTMKLPTDWLRKTFRVRRHNIYDALIWLKRHNPIYADVVIDESRLQELPENDVPDELLAIVRHEENDEVAEKERESYLTADKKHDEENYETEDDGE